MIAKTLNDVGLILAPTIRSRAYVQMLIKREINLGSIYVMPGEEPSWSGSQSIYLKTLDFTFRPAQSITESLSSVDCPVGYLKNKDINSIEGVSEISALSMPVLVYSGFPRILLKPVLLKLKTKFIHIHGGYLPRDRGATGFYYGLLKDGQLGMTAFWVNEGIDTGNIISRAWYQPMPKMDIDYILDPVFRADLLANILDHFRSNGIFPAEVSNTLPPDSPSHFIIHPVLKNLALRYAHNDPCKRV